MRRSFVIVAILSLVLLGAETGFPAAAKPVLGVRFLVQERNYADYYTDAERREIESRAAVLIRAALEARVGFLGFATETDVADTLLITLGQPEDAYGVHGIREVKFWLSVQGPRVKQAVPRVGWTFRPLDAYYATTGPVDGFVEEIAATFKKRIESNYDELVANLLSKLILAREAHPLQSEASWILPFSGAELQADEESEFLIRAELVVRYTQSRPKHRVRLVGEVLEGDPAIPQRFLKKLKGRVLDDAAGYREDMKQASQIAAKEIYLIKYVPLPRNQIPTTRPTELRIEEAHP